MSQPGQPGLRERIADEIHHARPRHDGCSLCNRIADAVMIALGGGTHRCVRCGQRQAQRGDTCPPCDLANATDVITEMRERAAVVQADLAAKDRAIETLTRIMERMPEQHMRFGILGDPRPIEDMPCADWCWACRLERAEAERDRLRAAVERVRDLRDKWLRWPEDDPHHAAGLMLSRYLDQAPAEASRCTSCDHLASDHQPSGCWRTVITGTPNGDLVCACTAPAEETSGT